LLAHFRVIEDLIDRTILDVDSVETDAAGHRRVYKNLVVHNEAGTPMDLAFEKTAIKTDARYLVVQRLGRAPSLSIVAVDATTVSVAGKPVHQSPKRATFEKRM